MQSKRGWVSMPCAPHVAWWIGLVLAGAACGDQDVRLSADTAGPAVSAIDAPTVVAIGGRNQAGPVVADSVNSVCPKQIRDLETGFEFVQAASRVVREATQPGSPLAVTSAKATYIRADYRLGDRHAHDTLWVDCRTMRRQSASRPGA